MSVRLGPAYPPDWAGVPRRMSLNDRAIWDRFAPTIRSQVLRFFFDCELGDGTPVTGDFTPEELEFWKRNTAKRADVIAETPDAVWLIELRERAQPNALGRLLVYDHLYRQDPPFQKPMQLWLVTDHLDIDTQTVATKHGIHYVVT